MPSRPISLVIVLFWLGTGVWLFMRDLWPRMRPGEPPAYTLMASDEAPRQGPPISWNIFHNGVNGYDLIATTGYEEMGAQAAFRDTFEMRTFIRAKQQASQKAPLRRLRSLIRITRDGELREVNAELHIAVKGWECIFDIDGPIAEGYLWPTWRIRIFEADNETEARVFDRSAIKEPTLIRDLKLPFQYVEFADHGIVFNPLHPPNRLDVLKPDQRWRMPFAGNLLILESLGVTLHALAQGERLDSLIERVQGTLGHALANVPLMEARVLPELELLPPSPQSESGEVTSPPLAKSVPVPPPTCRVIEAHDDDARVRIRIWVQQSEGERKGLVLRQETVFTTDHGEDVWVVHRD
jgi:hypothetical protein